MKDELLLKPLQIKLQQRRKELSYEKYQLWKLNITSNNSQHEIPIAEAYCLKKKPN